MSKAKPATQVKKIKKGKKISKVKRIKRKPVLDASQITVSKIEMIFEKFLTDLGIEVSSQYQIGYKFYDFHLKGTKILIEFDGNYWHCNPDDFPNGPENGTQAAAIRNDAYKNKLAAANGFTLIRIWESDFKQKPTSVAKKIKTILKEEKERSK